MELSENSLKLYEAVCFVDDALLPCDCRDEDLVFIIRATSHERAAEIADKALRRRGHPDALACRSIRHIGYDLHRQDSVGERILHRCRKNLAINLGYPEWTRSDSGSPWAFIGPAVENSFQAADSHATGSA